MENPVVISTKQIYRSSPAEAGERRAERMGRGVRGPRASIAALLTGLLLHKHDRMEAFGRSP